MPAIDLSWAAVWPILIRVIVIVVIAAVLRAVLIRLIKRVMSSKIALRRTEAKEVLAERTDTLSRVLVQITSIVIWIVAALTILSETGVDITPVLATVGLGALAIGLAAQNIIRDYLNGFFILMEDWYRVGEVAVINGNGGLVETITLRRTLLRDLNGTLHIIPNSKVEMASNMTRDWSRIHLNVGVAYKENLGRVFEVINEVGQQMKDDPVWGCDLLTVPHAERVDNLGDSGIEIKILADTKPIRQWALTGELRRRLKDRFDEEGIEIPWPHTKVYFGDEPPTRLPPQ
ncbi:MAG: mechanosensitive ion channel family protein [Chloroflexota bacterium]